MGMKDITKLIINFQIFIIGFVFSRYSLSSLQENIQHYIQ